ncbi:MAG: hypothetical protein Q4C47_05140 [Planctomycetia bacterium]|nr:hypothetical protein [Planctomycetia bacterium]
MSRNCLRAPVSRILWILALAGMVLPSLSGCARWNRMVTYLRGPGFTDNGDSELMGSMRDDEETGELWSFSEKGRQIERSMGSGI